MFYPEKSTEGAAMDGSVIKADTRVKMTQAFGQELCVGDTLIASEPPNNHGGFWATADKNGKLYWVMEREIEVITSTG